MRGRYGTIGEYFSSCFVNGGGGGGGVVAQKQECVMIKIKVGRVPALSWGRGDQRLLILSKGPLR